jgi:hypothetical protein
MILFRDFLKLRKLRVIEPIAKRLTKKPIPVATTL